MYSPVYGAPPSDSLEHSMTGASNQSYHMSEDSENIFSGGSMYSTSQTSYTDSDSTEWLMDDLDETATSSQSENMDTDLDSDFIWVDGSHNANNPTDDNTCTSPINPVPTSHPHRHKGVQTSLNFTHPTEYRQRQNWEGIRLRPCRKRLRTVKELPQMNQDGNQPRESLRVIFDISHQVEGNIWIETQDKQQRSLKIKKNPNEEQNPPLLGFLTCVRRGFRRCFDVFRNQKVNVSPHVDLKPPTISSSSHSDDRLGCVLATRYIRIAQDQRNGPEFTRVILKDLQPDELRNCSSIIRPSYEKWQETLEKDLDVKFRDLSRTATMHIRTGDGQMKDVPWNAQSWRDTIEQSSEGIIDIEIREKCVEILEQDLSLAASVGATLSRCYHALMNAQRWIPIINPLATFRKRT